jgi:hypothetical protein
LLCLFGNWGRCGFDRAISGSALRVEVHGGLVKNHATHNNCRTAVCTGRLIQAA